MAKLQLKRKNSQNGLVLVELAIILPLLIVLTFGLIEYGWMFLRAQEISNAARQGARSGATPAAGDADVEAAVDNVMTEVNLDASGYTVTISPSTDDLATGTDFTVTVAVPYDNIRLLNIPLIPTPTTLSGSTTMNKEGP